LRHPVQLKNIFWVKLLVWKSRTEKLETVTINSVYALTPDRYTKPQKSLEARAAPILFNYLDFRRCPEDSDR